MLLTVPGSACSHRVYSQSLIVSCYEIKARILIMRNGSEHGYTYYTFYVFWYNGFLFVLASGKPIWISKLINLNHVLHDSNAAQLHSYFLKLILERHELKCIILQRQD